MHYFIIIIIIIIIFIIIIIIFIISHNSVFLDQVVFRRPKKMSTFRTNRSFVSPKPTIRYYLDPHVSNLHIQTIIIPTFHFVSLRTPYYLKLPLPMKFPDPNHNRPHSHSCLTTYTIITIHDKHYLFSWRKESIIDNDEYY